MTAPFVKAHADGNDFLIVADEFAQGERAALARKLCARNTGIGADGVEWVREHDGELTIELTNADGSYAEISGNGTRCVAAWWAASDKCDAVTIHTGAGARRCEILSRAEDAARVRTSMGVPKWRDMTVETNGRKFSGIFVDVGNPHFVMLSEAIPHDWEAVGALLTSQTVFPSGANIEFVTVTDPSQIDFRIYERGVGPTLSSGTGTTASAVAAIAAGRTSRSVEVRSPGGVQHVDWPEGRDVLLTGEAHIIARGEAWVR